ncbi:hypothetical protein O181_070352 [Austropuccinia psidii MF-1]|uniref:Uncharacterized protein n=1 Tax=Austropuccinia psidii MF-1 TaxID=1389203 RepID=A0A9Q3I866_9BASI|nr:hypothetical protein [Austropuccinia psidii MF-1]
MISVQCSLCSYSNSKSPLDGTTEVPQLRANLDRQPNLEGEAPSRKEGRGSRRSSSFSGVVDGFPRTSRTTFKGPGGIPRYWRANSNPV